MSSPSIALPRASRHFWGRLTTPITSAPRPCQHLLRQFSQSQSWGASPEKIEHTTNSYQPYPLSPRQSSQPRNDPIPETSIAKPIPKAQDTRPPSQANPAPQPNVAIPENEAQKSKAAPPKRKLRPRKAAMKLTPAAVERLRDLLDQPEPKLIKVGVRNRGCSGLAYQLDYVEKPGPFDEEVEQDGVKVLIDSKALFSIIGSEMDWVEDKLNQRFIFHNPNIKEACGCGESFMV
ncbi:iron-binding protein iscA [Xylariaceae sp. FL0662B]|nr:iron-binding protein iscA [Xylariaceae sp. FL0662B]